MTTKLNPDAKEFVPNFGKTIIKEYDINLNGMNSHHHNYNFMQYECFQNPPVQHFVDNSLNGYAYNPILDNMVLENHIQKDQILTQNCQNKESLLVGQITPLDARLVGPGRKSLDYSSESQSSKAHFGDGDKAKQQRKTCNNFERKFARAQDIPIEKLNILESGRNLISEEIHPERKKNSAKFDEIPKIETRSNCKGPHADRPRRAALCIALDKGAPLPISRPQTSPAENGSRGTQSKQKVEFISKAVLRDDSALRPRQAIPNKTTPRSAKLKITSSTNSSASSSAASAARPRPATTSSSTSTEHMSALINQVSNLVILPAPKKAPCPRTTKAFALRRKEAAKKINSGP